MADHGPWSGLTDTNSDTYCVASRLRMDMQMTMQGPPVSGPERLASQLYRRARVTLHAGDTPAVGAGGEASSCDGRAAEAVVVLESEDVALLALLADGLAPAGVGRRLGLTERTVRRRLNRLCERLGVATPMQAVVWAVRHRVI